MADGNEMATPPKKKGGPGRPFQKGVSGNPGGSSRTAKEMRKAFLDLSPEAFAKLSELMRNGSPKMQKECAAEILDRAGLKGFSIEPDKHAFTDADGNSVESFVVRFIDTPKDK